METIIYSSPKKYIIIDIKNLLEKNNIPISSIQLYINVNMDRRTRRYGMSVLDTREKRGELTVPIEDFNEPLNDAETLEIHIEEEYQDKALQLVEEWNDNNVYRYCVYKSHDYEDTANIQRLLTKNDIPCDDVFTNFLEDNTEEYLICLDPALHERAHKLLENNFRPEPEIINRAKLYEPESPEENGSLRHILITLLIIITISFLLYKFRDKIPIVDKIYNFVIEWLNNIKGGKHGL